MRIVFVYVIEVVPVFSFLYLPVATDCCFICFIVLFICYLSVKCPWVT